jgi:hypothetical protein
MGGPRSLRVNPWATDLAPATLALGGLRIFAGEGLWLRPWVRRFATTVSVAGVRPHICGRRSAVANVRRTFASGSPRLPACFRTFADGGLQLPACFRTFADGGLQLPACFRTFADGGLQLPACFRTLRTAVCSHQMALARLRVPVGGVRRQAAVACGRVGRGGGRIPVPYALPTRGDLTNSGLGINPILDPRAEPPDGDGSGARDGSCFPGDELFTG